MRRYFLPLITLLFIIASCDDTTDTIGSTLTDTSDVLDVTSKTFLAASESFTMDSVVARSSTAYLGRMKDPETDTYIGANLLTQFHCYEDYADFPDSAKLVNKPGGKIVADSCVLVLSYKNYAGDSLSLMKCTLHEMSKPIENRNVYYSSFDPIEKGYIRNDGIHISKSYTATDLNLSEDVRTSTSFLPYMCFYLNDEYTDKNGVKYNNYGTYIMNKYYENPKSFSTSYNFMQDVCPGFYIQSTAGLGNMIQLYAAMIEVFYKEQYNDTLDIENMTSFASTEEVLQLTNFSQDYERLQTLAKDKSCTYLKTPSGVFTKVTLPVDSIMRDMSQTKEYALVSDTVNTVRLSLKRENNTQHSDYSLSIPSTVLVLPYDSVNNFFVNKEIADYRSSFIYTYSSSDNSYTFYNIATIVEDMAQAKKAYYEEHPNTWADVDAFNKEYEQLFPNWNKIAMIPVSTSYTTVSSTSVLTKVTNDLGLKTTRLVGGTGNANKDKINVSVIYSKFNSK